MKSQLDRPNDTRDMPHEYAKIVRSATYWHTSGDLDPLSKLAIVDMRFSLLLWPEGEFQTGLIELYVKYLVRKLRIGRIQDWANHSQIFIGRK